jgi:4-carboxymuconolactone decarboxylase
VSTSWVMTAYYNSSVRMSNRLTILLTERIWRPISELPRPKGRTMADTLPDSIAERRRLGALIRREVLGEAYVDASTAAANPFTAHFVEFTNAQCWGNVWLRDGLDRKTRSMLNLAMLSAMGRWHEFEVHTRGALINGVTPAEIAEVLLQTGVYAGIPVAAEGFRRANDVIQSVAAERAAKPAEE